MCIVNFAYIIEWSKDQEYMLVRFVLNMTLFIRPYIGLYVVVCFLVYTVLCRMLYFVIFDCTIS